MLEKSIIEKDEYWINLMYKIGESLSKGFDNNKITKIFIGYWLLSNIDVDL